MIRKMQRTGNFPTDVEVKIVSAMFGLIDALTPVPLYDLRMSRQRAHQLTPGIQKSLNDLFAQSHYSEIYVDLGTDYMPVLNGFVTPVQTQLVMANGRIGQRLHKLKAWLTVHSLRPTT